jgi:Fe-S oxidoreductase
VGVEPAVTLTYRDEYPHELGELPFRVQLLQEYLATLGDEMATRAKAAGSGAPFRLFGHCTERTFEPKSQELWKSVFESLGAPLSLEQTGCCGMCGVFGHEAEHYDESRGVFEMSWKKQLPEGTADSSHVLATGHSCRSQVKRFAGFVPKHPAEALVQHLNGSTRWDLSPERDVDSRGPAVLR